MCHTPSWVLGRQPGAKQGPLPCAAYLLVEGGVETDSEATNRVNLPCRMTAPVKDRQRRQERRGSRWAQIGALKKG